MSSDEIAASEPSEALPNDELSGSSTEEPGGSQTDWRAENTRLRQELKKRDNLQREALPFIQLGVALKQAPGGAAIIEKLQKGEPLTAAQEKRLEQAQQEAGSDLTVEKLEQLFDRKLTDFEQKLRITEAAKEDAKRLHAKAAKELPGYENLQGTPEWNRRLSVVINMINEGAIDVPDEEPSPHYFAIKEAWATLKKENPKLGKEKPAPKTEAERRAAISQAALQAGGVPPEEEDQLPEWARLGKTAKAVTGGRSFSSLTK